MAHDVLLKQVLASPAGAIVDNDVFDADKLTSIDTIIEKKAFAGPYTLESFKLNEYAEYRKNTEYSGLIPSKNDSILVRYYADSSNLKLAVQESQVDVAFQTLTPTDIADLREDGNVTVLTGPSGESHFIVFNFRIQPFGTATDDADETKATAVRHAIADVIDRQAIAENVFKDTFTPLYSFIASGLPGSQDTLKEQYGNGEGKPDIDKAAQALHDVGIDEPVELHIQYSSDTAEDEYGAIKSQLDASGLFSVDLQQTESTQYKKDRVITDDSDGLYPLYQQNWYPDYPDADNFLSPLFLPNSYLSNGYNNAQVNDLIVEQAGEQDASKREKVIQDIQEKLTEDLPTIPLVQGSQVVVTGKNVDGVVLDTSFRFRYSPLTIS